MAEKPMSRSERHSMITSYGGLVLSIVAIILSVVSMYQSYMADNREAVQILNVEDDGYYHYDGENLFKNYRITIANNSAIPISIVELEIGRNNDVRKIDAYELPDVFPLNMESNHAEVITVPWKIETSSSDNAKILMSCNITDNQSGDEEAQAETDRLLSSRTAANSSLFNSLYDDFKKDSFSNESSASDDNYWSGNCTREQILLFIWRYSQTSQDLNGKFASEYTEFEKVPLSVSASTAKSGHFPFTSEDYCPTSDISDEAGWIADQVYEISHHKLIDIIKGQAARNADDEIYDDSESLY